MMHSEKNVLRFILLLLSSLIIFNPLSQAQLKPRSIKANGIYAPYAGDDVDLKKLACGVKDKKRIFLIKDGKSYFKFSEWLAYQKQLAKSSSKKVQKKAKKIISQYPRSETKPIENNCKEGIIPPTPTPEVTPQPTPTPIPQTDGDEGDLSLLSAITRPLTDDDVRHLYQRAALGVVPDEAYVKAREGVEALVDFMMAYHPAPQVEADAARYLDDRVDTGVPADEPNVRETGLQYWSLYLLINSPNHYHERLAFFFFHNLLATSQDVLAWWQKDLMLTHMNLLRAAAIDGNYIPLLKKISRDPAMLVWLDGATNTKTAPNVNYARELFELFSLGSPDPLFPDRRDYTEADIRSSGLMHTGWGVESVEVLPDFYQYTRVLRAIHVDTDPRTIFEGTACQRTVEHNFDTGLPRDMEVIDQTFLCRHPEHFLGWRLAREYLNETPDPAVTLAISKLLRTQNFNFNKALKILFMSDVFYRPENRRSVVMSPVEQAVQGVLRAGMNLQSLLPEDTGNSPELISDLFWWMRDAGMRLTRFPTVFGTDPLEYANSAWQLQLQNTLINFSNVQELRPNRDGESHPVLWRWDSLLPPNITRPTSSQVVEYLLPRFNLTNLSTAQRNELRRILDNSVSYNGTTRTITSVNPSAFNSTNFDHVNYRFPRLWVILTSLNYLR